MMDVKLSNEDISALDKVILKLQNNLKLERDKGYITLNQILRRKSLSISPSQNDKEKEILIIKYCEEKLFQVISNKEAPWENLLGAINGIKCMVINKCLSQNKIEDLMQIASDCLQYDEVRVRLAYGELLGELCKSDGIYIYHNCKDIVLDLIKSNLERQIDFGSDDEEPNMRTSTSSADIFHETAGWRYLESSMKCLQFMIEGCSTSFNSCVNQEILDLLFTALTHTNRFVRETGFYVCGSLVNIGHSNSDGNSILTFGEQFSEHIALGLADNWSQVRLASSVCARNFLLSFEEVIEKEKYFPKLLPRLCLNRYYVAEGVRIYSQETWRLISNGKGRDYVAKYIDFVVEYYCNSTKADNHAVREAACSCIAELGDKIDRNALRDHVSKLLNVLLDSFRDDSWPVRDAACVACGKFVLNFAQEAKVVKDDLFSLFLNNLRDPISSVRQGAASAIANFVTAYGNDALDEVIKELSEAFEGLKDQQENVDKYSSLDKSPGPFGVVKRNRDNDMDLHTNQQMYSCGSLAPKMGRGNKESAPSGGCSSCTFKRDSEPWERADGCIYLFSLLLNDFKTCNKLINLIPLIVKATSYQHYTQHVILLETICKQLPVMAKSLGKKEFKKYLDQFFNPIFYACSSDVQLTKHAAEESLISLSQIIGPNILRGRIENYDVNFVSIYDSIIHNPMLPQRF